MKKQEIHDRLQNLLTKVENRYMVEIEGHQAWYEHFEKLLDEVEKDLKEILLASPTKV